MAHDTTEMHVPKTRAVLGVSAWVAIGGFVLALVGGGSALLTQLFTPAATFQTHLVDNEKAFNDVALRAAEIKGQNQTRDWKIESMQVQIANIEARQQRVDTNVVILLTRVGARPAPEPDYAEPPAPPTPSPHP